MKTVIELWDDTVIESVQNPTSPNPADVTTGEKPADSETSASEVDDDDDEEEINSNELKDLARNFKQGQSPLHRAVCTDKLKSVLKIVKDIESAKELVNLPNTKGWTPLHVACLLGMAAPHTPQATQAYVPVFITRSVPYMCASLSIL